MQRRLARVFVVRVLVFTALVYALIILSDLAPPNPGILNQL